MSKLFKKINNESIWLKPDGLYELQKDVIDEINDFLCHVHLKNISVSFSLHEYNPNHLLINYTKK